MTSEELLEVLSLSKHATAIYKSADIIIQSANDAMIAFWGKDRRVIGLSLEEAVPELKEQPFIDLLKEVWHSGITYYAKDTLARLRVDGELQDFFFDFEYRAILDESGKTRCILHMATDVTAQIKASIQLKELKRVEKVLSDELAESNEELSAINEEYQATNEVLTVLNANHLALNEELKSTSDEVKKSYDQLAQLHNQLIIAEHTSRLLLDSAPVAVGVLESNHYIIESANDKLLQLWGAGHDIIGKPIDQVLGEEEATLLIRLVDQIRVNGRPVYNNDVKRLTEHLGFRKTLYHNYIFFPVKNDKAETISVMIVANNVTEQMITRLELQRVETKMRMAVEAANIGTWNIAPKTMTLVYNPTLARLFGYEGIEPMTFDQAIGQVTEDYRERIQEEISQAITTGGDYDITYSQRRFNDGEIVWMRSMGKITQDSSGDFSLFSGLVMDITEQKKDEHRKNDFIGMVSHELKTPLTSLSAYVQILQGKAEKSGDTFAVSALHKAGIQVKKMSSLINGFLNVSRLEAGKILLVKKEFELDALIKESIEEFQLLSPEQPITFNSCVQVTVSADRDKIGNVINNLVSNAIKYSPKDKEIKITCTVIADTVEVAVEDQGMGIRTQDLPNLFERYYRVESEQTHAISGFGIGLYLSAEIIQRHGGQIRAESQYGTGSKFIFNLPINN